MSTMSKLRAMATSHRIIAGIVTLYAIGMISGCGSETPEEAQMRQEQHQQQEQQKAEKQKALAKKEADEYGVTFNKVAGLGVRVRDNYTKLFIGKDIRNGMDQARRDADEAVKKVDDMKTISDEDKNRLKEMLKYYDYAAGAAARAETAADLASNREYIGTKLDNGKDIEDVLRKELQDKINEEARANLNAEKNNQQKNNQ